MKIKHVFVASLLGFGFALPASAAATNVICTYAPSQSAVVAAIAGTGAGMAGAALVIAAATGMTVVTHSSGAMILTGSSGYVAGTLGASAVAPVIVTVGLTLAGAAVTLELVCANENHPEQVARVMGAAEEFARRFKDVIARSMTSVTQQANAARPLVGDAAVRIRRVGEDVWEYAYKAASQLPRN